MLKCWRFCYSPIKFHVIIWRSMIEAKRKDMRRFLLSYGMLWIYLKIQGWTIVEICIIGVLRAFKPVQSLGFVLLAHYLSRIRDSFYNSSRFFQLSKSKREPQSKLCLRIFLCFDFLWSYFGRKKKYFILDINPKINFTTIWKKF